MVSLTITMKLLNHRLCGWTRSCSRFFRSEEQGDVLLEYVLLTLIIILPLVGVSIGLADATGGAVFSPGDAVQGENFGFLGNAFVDRCRMVMSGVSLPLP